MVYHPRIWDLMGKKIQIRPHPPQEYGIKVWSCQIASELPQKNAVIDKILEILREKRFLDEEDELWSKLCLDELLVNAIKHGNKEDKNKKVQVSLYLDQTQWAVRIEDEGDGFDVGSVPDPDNQKSWNLEHGRGILLIYSYMDEIWYYDRGNRVQLKKLRKGKIRKLLDKILVFFKLK